MPLRNRVDPWGDLHAVPERGLFTGNRGVIHDPATRTLLQRHWATKAWLICECEYKGHRREVMGRNTPSGNAGWTELFFLDEVTALAAGHRPCFLCRRDRAKDFAARFSAEPIHAPEIDARLHGERLASGGELIEIGLRDLRSLPDGAMVFQGDRAFAKHKRKFRAWKFWGYIDAWDAYDLTDSDVWLITPPSTIEALRNGYRPVWHPSIQKPHN